MDDQTLERVSRRVRGRPEFWAWVFHRYDHFHGPHAGQLAAHLALSRRDFLRLGLYLRPRTGRFEQDARLAAADFGIDPYRLAEVAQFVDSLAALEPMKHGATTPTDAVTRVEPGAGFLAAARARRPSRPRRGRTRPLSRPQDGETT